MENQPILTPSAKLDTHAVPYDDAPDGTENKPLANVATLQFVADGKL